MRTSYICLFLLITGSYSWAQEIIWSSNRPQNTLIENCGAGEFILTNMGNEAVEVSIDLSGNFDEADISTDVLSSVNIQPGNAYTFMIEALGDNLTESNEQVVITVTTGDQTLHEVTLSLEDELFLESPFTDDFSICPGVVLLTATSNANITWMPGNVVNDTFELDLREETDVILTASQGSCMESLQFTISPE